MDTENNPKILDISPMQLAQLIDHTQLSAKEGPQTIKKLCYEAIKYNFYSVCINSCYVPLAVKSLSDTNIKICSVVGFPLGMMDSDSKLFETKKAVQKGADEIDMVINIGMLKSGNYRYVHDEISSVVSAADKALVKVIIETCYLTDEEKVTASEMSKDAGAHFIKTSTGFGIHGAIPEDVKLIRETIGLDMGVKAAGGIKSYSGAADVIIASGGLFDPLKFRIGASRGIDIIKELLKFTKEKF